MNKTEQGLFIILVGLMTFMGLNYVGDYMYRGASNANWETNDKNWRTQQEINDNQVAVNIIEGKLFEQLDKDVRSNMKVIDQLIGIVLGGEQV